MQKKEYELRAFDRTATQNKILSIRIAPDGLYFTVTDPSDSRLLYLQKIVDPNRSGTDILAEEIKTNKILSSSFLRKIVMYETPAATYLPSFALNETSSKEIASLNFDSNTMDLCSIHTDEVSGYEITTIYAIPEKDEKRIKDVIPDNRIIPHSLPLIRYSLTDAKKSKGDVLHLNVSTGLFHMVLVKENKMILCNSFSYTTTDEFLYYVLAIFDTYGLDQYSARCVISGDIDEYSETVSRMTKYIARMEYSSVPNGVVLKKSMNDIKNMHQYTMLLQVPLCL